METEEQVKAYREDGYYITDDAVDPAMLDELESALRRAVEKVRSGAVVDDTDRVRLNGEGMEPKNIRALMAPEFGEPVFSKYLLSDPLRRQVLSFLGETVRLGWVSAFVVLSGGYQVGWHRDFGKEERDGTYEVEMEILGRYRKDLVKWHLALVDDPCLWIVPGSHRRYRTAEEREVLINNPGGELSGGKQILLNRGQTVFWTGNTIHRGVMPADLKERLTLTGGLARHSDGDAEELDERYRWRLAENVRASLPDAMKPLYDNWRSSVEAARGA